MMTDGDDEILLPVIPEISHFFHVNVLGEVKENIMS